MIGLIICAVAMIVVLLLFFFNPKANRIRKINSIINKDRSVCDFIASLDGWNIDAFAVQGLRMVITPKGFPVYYLYITYNEKNPSDDKVWELYHSLTDPDSVVYRAHKINVPVDIYLEGERWLKYLEDVQNAERWLKK